MEDAGIDLVELSRALEGYLGVPPVVRLRGKRPLDADWPNGPRADPEHWRAKLHRHRGNIGAVTGAGLLVLDFDTYHPAGAETFEMCVGLGWVPANTVRTQTGGGGLHVWLTYDPQHWTVACGELGAVNLPGGGRFPGGAEWKADGGQVVVPPSVHSSGQVYIWEEACSPWDCGVCTAVDELLAVVGRPTSSAYKGRPDVGPTELDPATLEALEVLTAHFGAHDPTVAHANDGRPYLLVTRPGKDAGEGTSATVGFLGKGVTKIWSSNWPPFGGGTVVDLGLLRQMAGLEGPKIHVPAAERTALIVGAKVRSAKQMWLWKDHLPVAQLVIAAGQEKLGKSTAMVWVAAQLTKGELPGDLEGCPADVVFISGEDDNEHILKPRCVAAGIDLERVYFLDPRGPAFALEVVRDVHPALLVLDPLSMFVRANLANEHGEVAVRQALDPFNALAQDDGITVVGVRHVRKSPPGDNPYDVILGSRAWSAAARAVLFFTPDPEHQDRPGGLIFPRGNLARPGAGSRYRLDSVRVVLDDNSIADMPLFVLEEGGVSVNLEEALGPRDKVTGRLEAEQFLIDILKAGPMKAADVMRAAADIDIDESALQRARKKVGARSERQGFGKGSVVWWTIDGT